MNCSAILLLATAAFVATFSSDSLAQSRSTAALSEFTHTSSDLDPADSYTPALPQFAEAQGSWRSYFLNFPEQTEQFDANVPIDRFSSSVNVFLAWSTDGQFNADVEAHSTGGTAYIGLGYEIPVLVMPRTAITLTNHVSLSVDYNDFSGAAVGNAISSVYIDDINGNHVGTGEYAYLDSPGTINRYFAASYVNNSDIPVQLFFNSSIQALSVSAVPEPGMWLAFCAGMTFLGLTSRRKAFVALRRDDFS